MQRSGKSTDEPPDLLRSLFRLAIEAHSIANLEDILSLGRKGFEGDGDIDEDGATDVERAFTRLVIEHSSISCKA